MPDRQIELLSPPGHEERQIASICTLNLVNLNDLGYSCVKCRRVRSGTVGSGAGRPTLYGAFSEICWLSIFMAMSSQFINSSIVVYTS